MLTFVYIFTKSFSALFRLFIQRYNLGMIVILIINILRT